MVQLLNDLFKVGKEEIKKSKPIVEETKNDVVEETKNDVVEEKINLNKLTKKELKKLCDEKGIEYKTLTTKKTLIKLLSE